MHTVKLEKIEINGFKSFADKTEIILDGEITGIVGPNGSGKSNIADAVKWVLGEQNSKNLRGTKMEDVIFGGTQNKNQKSFCEVSLFFDNGDRRIPLDFTEVVITRRLYRSGESEYRINGAQVRLKDIVDVVRNTGIGREGYSIVGQGKIDEILSAKPEARRKVFEEAAGVMRFRARKEEAEGKLRKTEENLVRIGDILEELNTSLEPMKEQAEKTRSFLQLFERQKILDANIFLINNERATARLRKLSSDLEELEKEIWQDRNRFGNAVEETERITERLEIMEGELRTLREEYSDLDGAVTEAGNAIVLIDERRQNALSEMDRIDTESGVSREKSTTLKANEEDIDKIIEERSLILKETEEKLAGTEKAFLISVGKRRDTERELDAARKEYMSLLEEKHTYDNELISSRTRFEGLGERMETLDLRKASLEEQLEKAGKECDEALERLEEENGKALALSEERHKMETKLSDISERLEKGRDLLINEKTEKDKETSRAAFLRRLKDEYEGYSQSVRNLMKELRKSENAREGILGTLAELITVPERYEKAIESAVGGAMQNVVTESDADAKFAIELLRKNRLGRVSFMPLRSLKVRMLSASEERSLTGDMARADSVVLCDESILPAVRFLLGRTVIVKDLDTAIALARKTDHSFRVVTLEGDVINAGGTITGGSSTQRSFGLLSREREIELAESNAKKHQDNIIRLEASIGKGQAEHDSLQEDLDRLTIGLRESSETLARIKTESALVQSRRDELKSGIDEIIEEKEEMLRSGEEYTQKSESLETGMEKISRSAEEIGKKISALEKLLQEDESGKLSEEMASMRLAKAAEEGEIRRQRGIQELLRNQREELEKRNEDSLARYQELRGSISLMETERAARETEKEELEQKAAALKQDIDEKEARRIVENDKLRTIQKEGAEYQLRQTQMGDSKLKLQGQIERRNMSLENASERLWTDYGMTYAGAEELKDETISFTPGSRELTDIREQIRVLGPVNPSAIEEYERVRDRAEDLTIQKNDLEKAKADLEKLITGILSSMKVVFEEKFELINRNFNAIFRTLFGGGKAEISLEDGDVMEAGVEIVAEPPGKKIQNISALSGGERALTGIALLFAMIKINPSPVCLLDEIDAPLDEANVVRFCDYIKSIEGSQFVIITHRKPTMAICPVLYGVTMQERGISKIVSVRVSDD